MGPVGIQLSKQGKDYVNEKSSDSFSEAHALVDGQIQKLGALQCVTGENRDVTYLNKYNIEILLQSIQTMEEQAELVTAKEGASASLTAIKAQLGQLYETLINDAVAKAVLFHKQVSVVNLQKNLEALPLQLESLQDQVYQQIEVALLCNAKGTGMKREQRAGHIPVDRPALAVSHLFAANNLLQKKLAALPV